MCGGHKKKDNACKTFANGCVNKKYLLILNKVSSTSTWLLIAQLKPLINWLVFLSENDIPIK